MLFRRLVREEQGMTMGLVIIMIVLIGVMGAGLLTFVSTDLNNVVQVNQGQRAFEIADAGVQAAKQQLASDCTPVSTAVTIACAVRYDGIGVDDVQWARSAGMKLENLDNNAATTDSTTVTIRSQLSPANSFKVTSTGGYGNAKRKIEAILRPYSRVNLPLAFYAGTRSVCDSNGGYGLDIAGADFIVEGPTDFNSNCAISMNNGDLYVGGTANFDSNSSLNGSSIHVNGSATFDSNVSIGSNDGIFVRDDATFDSNARAVSAERIYIGRDGSFNSNTELNNTVTYVGRNVSFGSNSRLLGTSELFAGGNVTLSSSNFALGPTTAVSRYGNWQNASNPTARPSTAPGIGAVGTISGSGAANAFKGTRSFDVTTGDGLLTGRQFVSTLPLAPRRMTFPFNPAQFAQPLTDIQSTVTASKLTDADVDDLKQIAIEQEAATGRDHYRPRANGTTSTMRDTNTDAWPRPSSTLYGYGTVVFYEFPSYSTSNRVVWDANPGCDNTERRGVLVIKNGDFSADSNNSGFNGWVIVRGGKVSTNSNTCMNAFINSQGGIFANSNTQIRDPIGDPTTDLSAFYGVKTLGWRECYTVNCS